MSIITYTDIARAYDEPRAYDDLTADERAWWDDALARLQAVADACDSLTAEQRHRVIHAAAGIGDLDAAISAQETALGEVMREESDLADTDAAVWVQSQGAEVPA